MEEKKYIVTGSLKGAMEGQGLAEFVRLEDAAHYRNRINEQWKTDTFKVFRVTTTVTVEEVACPAPTDNPPK